MLRRVAVSAPEAEGARADGYVDVQMARGSGINHASDTMQTSTISHASCSRGGACGAKQQRDDSQERSADVLTRSDNGSTRKRELARSYPRALERKGRLAVTGRTATSASWRRLRYYGRYNTARRVRPAECAGVHSDAQHCGGHHESHTVRRRASCGIAPNAHDHRGAVL